ncbi:hypothetical protein KFL_007430060 [Klebsormidium nitens]|uniref:MYND-type domain-containing protein n=1 Tax=Klebsormidium nitens TaxID=105231 RepID=A0A1Y1ISQ1_KLENI|nr:hypothetical protein KFL_007430060 [Klebsormidium nitens]|eukprot:GAQ91208.1 hypothetical protein KFL_007430060 [Klebsormidium nitens]
MRAHNALSGLKPHKKKINAAPPIYDLGWYYIEARMQGKKAPIGLLRNIKEYKLKHTGDGDVVPVVCSWKLCTEGPETGEKKFGKCALCQIARYCSKEHQKLHWPSHKIHCQASRARTFDS